MPDDNAAFQAIDLDSAKVASACARYPFAVRQAFKLATQLQAGQLEVRMPDGRAFRITGEKPGPEAVMIVRDLDFAGSLAQGDIGVAESYLRGQWDSPDLTAFLELFCVNQPFLERLLDGKPVVRLMQMAWHWMNRNTRAGSKRNIHAHYDLGNSFYGAWLDDSMT